MKSNFPSVRFERQCGDDVPMWLYWETITINGYCVGRICCNTQIEDDYALIIEDTTEPGRIYRRHHSIHPTVADAKAAFFALPSATLLGLVNQSES